jgi:hypothetical protein
MAEKAETRERVHRHDDAATGTMARGNGGDNGDNGTDDPGSDVVRPPKPKGPDRYKIRLTHPLEGKKVAFSSVSEMRARRFLMNRFPRGEEAYLEMPDGSFESYQHEREGEHGEDAEQWSTDFDPDSWLPPEEMAPPGEAAWADVEA